MRKLSTNMEEVLQCLTDDYMQFGDICEKYGQLQNELYNHNSKGYVWESLVSRVLNTLIKHKLVEHGKRGEYRKLQLPQATGIKIWDNHNKQWLEPMVINFGKEGLIWRVTACKPGEDPLSDGWYDLEGEDLKKIAITGDINMNIELLPK